MLPRTFRKLLNHKSATGPLWALLFCSVFLLPLVASTNIAEGRAKTNKYDNLIDNAAYVDTTFAEYLEDASAFEKDKTAFFFQSFDVDEGGEPILFVISDFANVPFGFPYLEGSFISLPNDFEFRADCFYPNFDCDGKTITENDKTYSFGGKTDFIIPCLNPLETAHPINKICLLVRSMDHFEAERGGIACYDCSNVWSNRFDSASFGKAIKRNYQEENAAFSSYVQFMAMIPSLVSMLLVVFLSSLFLFVDKKNAFIAGFYAISKKKNFIDSLLDWSLIIGAPVVLGLASYVIVSVVANLPISGGLVAGLIGVSVAICLIFSLIENRTKGDARCRNSL